MERIDPARIPAEALDVLGRLAAAGREAYLVGGCVRDLVDGRVPKDYDVATSAPADEVASLFPRTVPTGLKHGTVTVLSGGLAVEVTTFRSEGAYHDHRRPSEVVFHGDLAKDLARRDFTCNAMAWSERDGLVDLHGGREDMAAGRLRTVGDPSDRFREDALRMLRAVRFCCTLGYVPVPALRDACAAHAGLLAHVSAERIAGECTRIFASPHPERLADFDGTNLLDLAFGRVLPEREGRSAPPFGAYLAHALSRFGPSPEAGYALLLLHGADDGVPEYAELRRRLMAGHRLSARVAGRAASLARIASSLAPVRAAPPDRVPALLRRLAAALARASGQDGGSARRALLDGARLARAVAGGDDDAVVEAAEAVLREGDPVTPDELALSGDDLVAAGHPSGPSLGRLRLRLLDAVLEDPARNRRAVLSALADGMV